MGFEVVWGLVPAREAARSEAMGKGIVSATRPLE